MKTYFNIFWLHFLLNFINGAKILIFVPGLSNSNVGLNYRLGELLAENGHDVTLFNVQYDPDLKKVKLKSSAKEIIYKALKNQSEFGEMMKVFAKYTYSTTRINLDFLKFGSKMTQLINDGCETQVSDKKLLKKLKDSNYDLAVAHSYDFCPIGMIKLLNIPTYIWMSSASLFDFMAVAVGSPVPSSYVPNPMSSFSDRMTFVERFQNFMGQLLYMPAMRMLTINPETQLFRKYHDEKFTDLFELASKAPLVFVNSEELLDFPRPILHKVIYVGGIGLKVSNKPLEEKWQKIMDDSQDGVVLFSFGSIADPTEMPQSWKDALLNAFSKFSSYTFLLKYDGELSGASKLSNVIFEKWVPQNDMFAHPKMKGFITHAGYNSILEAAINGIPLLTIPLVGDQQGNRRKAERHGIAIGLDKEEVTAKNIENALDRILHNSTYKENAERLSRMIRNKPFKPEEVVVRWVDFLAEFKELPNLEPVAIELSLIEYFLLDVLASIFLGLILVLYIVFRVVCFVYGKACAKSKTSAGTKRKAE